MRHVVWDWNGTLLDDLHIVVESVNEALVPFSAGPIDADGYRDHYQRPLHRFYDVLLGRPVTEVELSRIDDDFHEAYRRRLARAGLHETARPAVEAVAAAGGSQSVLSMWWHDELVPAVRRFELEPYMARVDGNGGNAGELKAATLDRHLVWLTSQLAIERSDVVMVGDVFDDAAAAEANGIGCVLFASGSHHRHELEATGHPVVDSLTDALAVAGVVDHRPSARDRARQS